MQRHARPRPRWVAAFLFAAAGSVSAEPIPLAFQAPLQDKAVSELTIELGGYDVTHFSRLEGEGVVIDLPSALDPGQYQAEVRVFYEDGEVQTLVQQLHTVAPPAATDWRVNASVNTSYRIDEKESRDFRDYDELHTSGGLQGNVSTAAAGLEFHAGIQTVYDTSSGNSASGDEAELAGYQAGVVRRGDSGSVGLHAGDTRIAQENLLFSNYQRRGSSLRGETADGTLQAGAFSVLSDLTTSYSDDLVWPEERSERTTGATLALSPWSHSPERLTLGLGYVDGEGTAAGSGFSVIDPDTVYGGNGWNLTADSMWLDRALWLHLDWADASFDSDGIGVGEGKLDDQAWQVLVQLNSGSDLPAIGLDRWSLTLKRQNVGTDFYSIANLALPGDLDSSRVSFSGSKGGLGFLAEWAEQENNEEDDPTRATLSIDYAAIEATYSPAVDLAGGPWSVLGAPSLTAAWRETDSEQDTRGTALSGVDVDNTTRDLSLGASFSRDQLAWSLTYTLIQVDDDSAAVFQNGFQTYVPLGDTESRQTTLQVSWQPGPRLRLSPYVQWATYEEDDPDNRYATTNYGFEGHVQLIPARLLLDVNYLLSRNDYKFGDPGLLDTEVDSHTGNFQLVWKAVPAGERRPGADLYLNGSYGRQDLDTAGGDTETWQVRAGLSIYWAGSSQ